MSAAPENDALATFELQKSPPLMSEGFIIILGLLAALFGATIGALLVKEAGAAGVVVAVGAVVVAAAGVLLVYLFRNTLTLPKSPPPIAITATTLHIAKSARESTAVAVPLERITSIDVRSAGAKALFVVGTVDGSFSLPTSLFGAAGAATVRESLRSIIGARADGAALLAKMDEREAADRLVFAVKTRATFTLLFMILGLYCAQFASGAVDDKALLLRFGGNAPALVDDGQWWRLFTASFLHLTWFHIYLNAVSLRSLGVLLEKVLGTPRFLIAALTGGLCGNLLSAFAGGAAFSVGASSMIFGLLGALVVVNVKHRAELPAGFTIARKQTITLLLVNGAISLLPGVDALAHLGGFAGGALTMLLCARTLKLERSAAAVVVVVAVLLGGATLAGGLAAIDYATTTSTTPQEDFNTARLHARRAVVLNAVAWDIAIDPASSSSSLTQAEEAARTAVAADPNTGELLDTHAYLLLRLGRADEAIAQERQALWLRQSPSLATMLGRMLEGRSSSAASITREGADVVVHAEAGAVVYARVVRSKKTAGLLRVVLASGATEGRAAAPGIVDDAAFEVLLVDAAADRAEKATSSTQLLFVPVDAATLALPWR
ncbi:MAG: rhomboid family intramembrane serine protease [Deltaproteobacteria bacterium]|nr:rhomboid family intramembrane serine protease [Deltaproteobacteria bacterium]